MHLAIRYITHALCYDLVMTSASGSYGKPKRGITATDVAQAADAIFRSGTSPTVRNVRERLGVGGFNTITPLLNDWWKKLSSRLDSGPKALDRLPESIAHIAEALWLQALEEGKNRATQALSKESRTATEERQGFELRSHVLSLREGELQSRLEDKDKLIATLGRELEELKLLWRKESATRQSVERQLDSLRAELLLAQKKRTTSGARPSGVKSRAAPVQRKGRGRASRAAKGKRPSHRSTQTAKRSPR